MKKISTLFIAILISSCDILGSAPRPLPIQTAISSSTPVIVSATPLIIQPPTQNSTLIPSQGNNTSIPVTMTEIAPPTSAVTDQLLPTETQPTIQAVSVEILGCDTGIDILNGMGEVTNAYVTVKNTGTGNLPNLCSLLRAVDEGRSHPDKKVCVNSLPVQTQITFKLTVDTTYQKDTVIQVDATTNDLTLLRLDKQSCRDINLFGGTPADLGVVKPAP